MFPSASTTASRFLSRFLARFLTVKRTETSGRETACEIRGYVELCSVSRRWSSSRSNWTTTTGFWLRRCDRQSRCGADAEFAEPVPSFWPGRWSPPVASVRGRGGPGGLGSRRSAGVLPRPRRERDVSYLGPGTKLATHTHNSDAPVVCLATQNFQDCSHRADTDRVASRGGDHHPGMGGNLPGPRPVRWAEADRDR